MVKKIIISRLHNLAVIIQRNQVEDLIIVHNSYQVSDIYLGVINKIFKSINAAFVNLDSQGKSGFLHVSDSVPLKRKYTMTSINQILTTNQKVLVQITKEPTSQKGPRLTANLALSGRYIILMPFSRTVCISRKVSNLEERCYLKALAILIRPFNMGLLFRQYANGVDEEIILQELNGLKKQWYFIEKCAVSSAYPSVLYREYDIAQRILRDFYNLSITNITVDSSKTLLQLQRYLKKNSNFLKSVNINLTLSTRANYLLEASYITPTIFNALKTKIKLPLGGSICIETFEALTIIDVNSGSFNNSPCSKETVLRTNFFAATEIAYQLRIRNITGLIIVDFIDMQRQRDQIRLLKHFCQVLELDNAKPQIVQLSELGLVELTRRRRGKNIAELLVPYKYKDHNRYIESRYNNFNFYTQDNKHIYQYLSADSTVYDPDFNTNSIFLKKVFLSIYVLVSVNKNVHSEAVNFNSLLRDSRLMENNNIYVLKSKISLISLYLCQKVIYFLL